MGVASKCKVHIEAKDLNYFARAFSACVLNRLVGSKPIEHLSPFHLHSRGQHEWYQIVVRKLESCAIPTVVAAKHRTPFE